MPPQHWPRLGPSGQSRNCASPRPACFLRHLNEADAEKTLDSALAFRDKIVGAALARHRAGGADHAEEAGTTVPLDRFADAGPNLRHHAPLDISAGSAPPPHPPGRPR
jgi:hypothetical protein